MAPQDITQLIINYLQAYQPLKISLFGSFARGDETASSDVDILIDVKARLSLLDLVKIKRELSELLGRKVDVVTENALTNPKLRRCIEKDLRIIFQ